MSRADLIKAFKDLQRDAFDTIEEAQNGVDIDQAQITYLGRSEARLSVILESFLGYPREGYSEKEMRPREEVPRPQDSSP